MPAGQLHVWMDVMRGVEPIIADYERLFDAWAAGGVDGLVIGPMTFADGAATFDPDPAVYQRLGVPAPPAPAARQPEQRVRLDRALQAAKDRGWQVWLFQPGIGGAPRERAGSPIVDEQARAAWSARSIDTLQHYPMADGGVLDGPEWGYEIAPGHMVRNGHARSNIFDDLPESAAPACAALGYDYRALVAAKDRLAARLHALSDREVARHGGGRGGLLGGFGLFGGDPDLLAWLAFRLASLTACFADIVHTVKTASRPGLRLAAGPRSAAFAPLCGYDLPRLADILDLLLPKHYFWHRGFDGMYGTIARYVETLTAWNPDLSEAGALAVVSSLFGLELPEVASLADFDAGLPRAFFETIVTQETTRVLAATGDPERVVAWVDSGRRPHEGDPMNAGDLGRLLDVAAAAGLRRFIYHHHQNLTAGEWAAISRRCGTPWQTADAPPLTADLVSDPAAMPGYYPPDKPVL
jgi:hypothetical protein